MDMVPLDEMVPFCTDIILEKRKYHEQKIFYNEVAVARLCNDIRILLTLKQLHKEAMGEYQEGKVAANGRVTNMAKTYRESGMASFERTGVGLLTEGLLDKYRTQLDLGKCLANRLIIPSWCTPEHVCSFESSNLGDPLNRRTFFINGEKGWYGRPERTIYPDLRGLLSNPGCTWDKKLNHWAEKPLDLDETLPVKTCLQIWTESRGIKFKQDPLGIIAATNSVGMIKHNLEQLNLSQISELEKRFGLKLKDFWQARKQHFVTIGFMTFVSKDMMYYVESHHGLIEVANFSIEIDKIVRRKKKGFNYFYRVGTIYHHGKQEPFELPNSCFLTVGTFVKTINQLFLERGLGIPIISSQYRGYLLEVINRFNLGCMIDPDDDGKVKKAAD